MAKLNETDPDRVNLRLQELSGEILSAHMRNSRLPPEERREPTEAQAEWERLEAVHRKAVKKRAAAKKRKPKKRATKRAKKPTQ